MASVLDHNYACLTFEDSRVWKATDWSTFLDCRYCLKREFDCYKSRQAHEMVHHPDLFTYEKTFICDCCDRKFYDHDSYFRHKRGYYKGYCEICKTVFMDILEHDRRKHVRSSCHICGKQLRSSVHVFNQHMSKAHGMVVPGVAHFDCKQCKKVYLNKAAFNQHMYHVHKVIHQTLPYP
jgi:hypothetical protein